MKNFALFLLIPMTSFAAGTCDELGKYYADFEKTLANKTVINKNLTECGKFKDGVSDEAILQVPAVDDAVYSKIGEPKTLLEQVQCEDLSFIENRMRDVENKLNALNGFKKLVETIDASQEDIIVDKAADKLALEGFIADVSQAALLETLVSNPVFFKFMTEIDLTTPNSFKDGVEKNCVASAVKKLRKEELCKSLISQPISESSLTTLKELKAEYVKADNDTKKTALLDRWNDELIITKEIADVKPKNVEADDDEEDEDAPDNSFSFAKLNEEIQSKPTGTIAEMQKTIKSTTRIEHVKGVPNETIDKLFTKIVTFQAGRDKNKDVHRLLRAHTDMYERQKAEKESRLSLLWLEFRPTGSSETDPKRQLDILNNIANEPLTPALQATHLSGALRALDATTRQMSQLEFVTKCLDQDQITKDNFKAVCEKTVKRDAIDTDVAQLLSELDVLKTVKAEIVNEEKNPATAKLIRMRNLAMDALEKKACIDTKFESNISDCNIEGVLNPEMKNILITGLDVSLMYIQPSDDELEDAKEICEGAEKSEYNAFCALALKVESKSKRPDRSKETYNGPMDPESRNNPFSAAMYNGARNVASMLGQMIQQNRAPYYMTNGPGSYGPASPTISSYLIGSSMASGQLKPYSSVTQNNFAYKPLR